MHPQKGSHHLRKGRYSESGRIYLVTSTTHNRIPLFHDFELACAAIGAFTSAQALQDTRLLCWVLMPDHAHWLIQLDEGNLSKTVQRMKSLAARSVNQATKNQGSIWQTSFHDHALRKEEDIRGIARYIVANPLRAGLVNQVGDYPFWDAIWIE